MNEPTPSESVREHASVFQIFLVVLSLYILGALVVQSLFDLSSEMDELIERIDAMICLIFFGDFCYRFYHARSKLIFMRWGWIDLLSCIPMIDIFRSARVFSIVRLIKILRTFRSLKVLGEYLFKKRIRNTFVSVAAVSCFLTLASSMVVLKLERDAPGSNIKNPSDALWWSIVTVTTVGYGDRYPVTDAGRVVAAILMTAGVCLFGTFTGFVASMFVEPDIQEEENDLERLTQEIRLLRENVKNLELKVDQQNSIDPHRPI